MKDFDFDKYFNRVHKTATVIWWLTAIMTPVVIGVAGYIIYIVIKMLQKYAG